LLGSLFLCFLAGIIFWTGEVNKANKLDSSQAIRSDLPIPAENALVHRSELLAQIEAKFKSQMRGIKTIALLGIGGAGKTITARQYARSQNSPIVWEINAETQQSLLGSLENLARSLVKTEKDENVLKKLKDVKNSAEKEAKLLVFLKEKLKASPSWFLFFDNVENFTDIQPYFPQDVSNWGEGRILITTPNSNIQSNKNINNTILVGELGKKQELDFFIKLMQNGNVSPFTVDQVEEAKEFLEGVPPFPLDISIAAGYLKATHATYRNYLEKLHKQEKGFVEVQENLLRESGGYKNKRHDIVIMSLKQLINKNPDFKELLLFISLLDSQHIPRDLLNAYKGDDIVDSFIYNLKKYSLVTNEVTPSSQTEGTFSIHRSTQEISLDYLSKLLSLEKDNLSLLSIMTILEEYLAKSVEKGDVSKMRLLATHCEKILSHKNLFEVTGVLAHAGGIYRWLWNMEKAESFLQQAIENYKTYFPTSYNDLGIALTYLGLVYRDDGEYQKAQNVLEEAVESFKKETKKNIWQGTSLVTLGNTYRDLGKYEDAEKYIEEGISFYNKNFPTHYFQIGMALSYLGAIERDLGNYEEARSLFEEGLKNYKKDSEDNVWYAWTLIHLAEIYRTLGNYEKALRLAEKSVSFYK
jgi:tetratricopeptide (TPR) repeat protein